ncbi:conserved TPR repeat protein of unknown function [Alkalihalophilus pseudofirmus OF4]|uniref:Uncharacterized protein n=2 Tax=Alkalihalophilus pseudofirmus TaxID=79885 RepID=D3FWC9_ALKPO|nr:MULTISPECIES: hypothetical protein [Alkalihalophilus]ADC48661.1 conserved TPR repeat protein of unknown function [Alkalihalophilus pseudofirmus OF4]MDV2885831.1 hypothetical protein [Alkalihalophilus pseudofirmus]MED1602906.1 hypothetical protein [Alkalihalophilus marmarensis]
MLLKHISQCGDVFFYIVISGFLHEFIEVMSFVVSVVVVGHTNKNKLSNKSI